MISKRWNALGRRRLLLAGTMCNLSIVTELGVWTLTCCDTGNSYNWLFTYADFMLDRVRTERFRIYEEAMAHIGKMTQNDSYSFSSP